MTKIAITGLVAVHLAASLWHGSAHTHLGIELSTAKTAFVFAVILVAPIVGAALVWTRFIRIGLWVFFLSMLGAFLFGVYHHYVFVSPDNISHLPSGSPEFHSQFITTAGVIAALELASALYGALRLRAHYMTSQTRG